MNWLESLEESEAKDQARQSVLAKIAETNPSLALEQLTSNEDPELISKIATSWAWINQDWGAAYDWLLSKDGDGEALSELFQASRGNAVVASERLRELLIQRPDLDASVAHSTNLLTSWMFNEAPELIESWIESLPVGSTRANVISVYAQRSAAMTLSLPLNGSAVSKKCQI